MASPTTPTPRPERRRSKRIAVLAAIALAFGVGRWTVDSRPASTPAAQRARPPSPPGGRDRSPSGVWPPAAASGPALPSAVPAAAPPPVEASRDAAVASASAPPRTALSPETRARVHEDASSELERTREHVVARCWPRDGLPGGRRRTTVTYDVTFDPAGREIARGVLEDRRAPAGEFGRCLRRLEGTSLSVEPPGTFVTLRLPVTYP
jgi:hypothetical protein